MTQDEARERLRVLLDRLPEDERRRFEALADAEMQSRVDLATRH